LHFSPFKTLRNNRTTCTVLSLVAAVAVVGTWEHARAQHTNFGVDNSPEESLSETLAEMGYEDIEISDCWISFARSTKPARNNGFTKQYIRFVNIDYLKEFSAQEIQQVGRGQNSFYGFETRLDDSYPLRPLNLVRFREWVESNYPGANWPNVPTSEHRKALPKIEAHLEYEIPNIDQLNRWVSIGQYGKSTEIDQFFQMTWKERDPLERFLATLKVYGTSVGCDMEN
jgi:hypothetical protein